MATVLKRSAQIMATYALTSSGAIRRTTDGATIPADPGNRDYADYLAWIAAGNTPQPYVPAPPDPSSAIASSSQSLRLARAKQSLAQGDTAGALALLIQHIEGSLP
jgi:hypothetical protein